MGVQILVAVKLAGVLGGGGVEVGVEVGVFVGVGVGGCVYSGSPAVFPETVAYSPFNACISDWASAVRDFSIQSSELNRKTSSLS